jgi:hypothetical protein
MSGIPQTEWERIAPWLLAAAIIGTLALLASGVESQASASDETVTVLARALELESTMQPRAPRPADWPALLHVLEKRMPLIGASTIEDSARAYVSGLRCPSCVAPASRWKLELQSTCERPPSFPAGLSWEAWRPGCVEAFAFARAFLAGEVADTHPRAMHWGGRMDSPKPGMLRIDDGKTPNRLYAVSAKEASGR